VTRNLIVVTLPFVVDSDVVGVSDVSRRTTKRTFDASFKARIVAEYEAMPAYGPGRGVLLRREGLHRRQIHEWRQNLNMKQLSVDGDGRSRRPKRTADQIEIDRLKTRNAKLEAELARTRLALEITGKAHALLELLAESADTEKPSQRF
jgi:transposase